MPRRNRAAMAFAAVAAMLFGAAMLAPAGVTAGPSVTSFTPTIGGTEGGVRLTITGTGFANGFDGANQVYIGTEPCEVEQFYGTETQIVCFTPRYTGPSYDTYIPITVVVNGHQIASCDRGSGCDFRYYWWRAPELHTLTKVLRDEGRIDGYGKVFHDMDNIDMSLGGRACDMHDPEDPDVPLFLDGDGEWKSFACAPDNVAAGYYNFSLRVDGDHGDIRVDTDQWQFSGDRLQPHTLQVLPVVQDVTPARGSTAGGTKVTITGTGFQSDAFEGDIANNVVKVGGITCDVTDADHDFIECTTRAWDAAAPEAAPLLDLDTADPVENRRFAGPRGVLWESYIRLNEGSGWTGMPILTDNENYPHNPNMTKIVDSLAVDWVGSEPYNFDFWGVRMSGLFVAPRTGTYRTILSGDDRAEIWLSTDANPENMRRVAHLPSHTGHMSWTSYHAWEDANSVLEFEAGKEYFIQVIFAEWGGADHVHAGFQYVDSAEVAHEADSTHMSFAQDPIQRIVIEAENGGSETMRIEVAHPDNSGTFTLALGDLETQPLAHNASAEEVDDAIESLFDVPCTYANDEELNFFDIDNFEEGAGSTDDWGSRNWVNPVVRRPAWCGRYGLHMQHDEYGGSWGRNFEGATNYGDFSSDDGYLSTLYPYMCMAYRLPPTTVANMLIHVNGYGWKSLTMTSYPDIFYGDSYNYPPVGDWSVIADGEWHYNCIDVDAMLQASLGSGNYRVSSLIWHSPRDSWRDAKGPFMIDEFSITDAPRFIARDAGFERMGLGLGDDEDDALAGFELSSIQVSRTSSTTEEDEVTGAPPSTVFTVTFNPRTEEKCATANVPLLVAAGEADEDAEAPVVTVETLNAATPTLGGDVLVSFRGSHEVAINRDMDPRDVRELLLGLGTFGSDIRVFDTRHSCWKHEWTVYLTGMRGNQPLMEVKDHLLDGGLASGVVSHVYYGGIRLFPLSGSMLRVPTPAPALTVEVNGILGESLCDVDQADFAGCGFVYDDDITPRVTGVSPASGTAGTEVTVTGQRFSDVAEDNVVMIGGAECVVTAVEADGSELTCTAGEGRGGSNPVSLLVEGVGLALSDVEGDDGAVFEYSHSVSGVAPNDGSYNGGVVITISGTGFVATPAPEDLADSGVSVTVSTSVTSNVTHPAADTTYAVEAACELLSVAYDEVRCAVPSVAEAVAGNDDAAAAIDVHVAGSYAVTGASDVAITISPLLGDAVTTTEAGAFTYDWALTPSITGVSPASGPAVGNADVTISGSGFGTDAEGVSVLIGSSPCTVTAAADDSLECTTGTAVAPGAYTVSVVVADAGSASPASDGADAYTYEFHVDAMAIVADADGADAVTAGPGEVLDVGIEGGALLQLSGAGFGTAGDVFDAAVAAGAHAEQALEVSLRTRRADVQVVTAVAAQFSEGDPEHDDVLDVQTVTIGYDDAAYATWVVVVGVSAEQDLQAEGCCGTVALSVNNVSASAPVAFLATAEEIAEAVVSTGATDTANVTVTDLGNNALLWEVVFAGARADVGDLQVESVDLPDGSYAEAYVTTTGAEPAAGSFSLQLVGHSGATAPISMDADGATVAAALDLVEGKTFDVVNATRTEELSTAPASTGGAGTSSSFSYLIYLRPHPFREDQDGRLPDIVAATGAMTGTIHASSTTHHRVGQAGHHPISGSFKLQFDGATTEAIAANAAAQDVADALAPVLEAADVRVVAVTHDAHVGGDANAGGFGASAGYGYGNTDTLFGTGTGASWYVTMQPASHVGARFETEALPLMTSDTAELYGTDAAVTVARLDGGATHVFATTVVAHEDGRIVAELPSMSSLDDEYNTHVLSKSGGGRPVSYYKFDGPAGAVGAVNDGSLGAIGDLHVATEYRAALGASGFSRRTPSFGLDVGFYQLKDQHKTVVNYTGASVPFRQGHASQSFALEAWIRFASDPSELSAAAPIVTNAHVSGDPATIPDASAGYLLWINPCGRFEAWLGTGTPPSGDSFLDAASVGCAAHDAAVADADFEWAVLTDGGAAAVKDQWYHVVVQHEATNGRAALYVDGVAVVDMALDAEKPFVPKASGELTVGGLPLCEDIVACPLMSAVGGMGQPEALNATLDEVAVFDHIIGPAVIAHRAAWDAAFAAAVSVQAVGVDAVCEDGDTGCAVTIDAGKTPVVRRVSPDDGYIGTEISIHGNGFSTTAEHNHVDIGGAECAITSVTESLILCDAGEQELGRYPVTVTVRGKGAASSFHTFAYIVVISNVSPNQGSMAGGTLITVSGWGFNDDFAWNRVHVQNVTNGVLMHHTPCEIVSASYTQLQCRTPAADEFQSGNLSLSVGNPALPDKATLAEFRSAACAFIFRPHTSPWAHSVSPLEGGEGTEITIEGSGFTDLDEMSVTIGEADCAVTAAAEDQLTCILGAGGGGPRVVTVHNGGDGVDGFHNLGTAMAPWYHDQGPSAAGVDSDTIALDRVVDITHHPLDHSREGETFERDPVFANRTHLLYHYTSSVASASLESGSAGGGQSLTLTGEGFGSDAGLTEVYLGTAPCDITDISANSLTCTTRAYGSVSHDFGELYEEEGTATHDATGHVLDHVNSTFWSSFNEAASSSDPVWQLRNGFLQQNVNVEASGDGNCGGERRGAHLYTGDATWQDYTVSARVFTDTGGDLGITARMAHDMAMPDRETSSYYRVVLDTGSNCATLQRVNHGKMAELARLDMGLERDRWHTLSLTVRGPEVVGYVNGDLIGHVIDDGEDSLTHGMAGLMSHRSGDHAYDDFEVRFHATANGYGTLPDSGIVPIRVFTKGAEAVCADDTEHTFAGMPLRPAWAVLYNETSYEDPATNETVVVSLAPAVPDPEDDVRTGCLFQYAPASTPSLLSVELANGAAAAVGGETLQVRGEGFGPADDGDVAVTVGGRACPVTSATTQLVECTLPQLPAGTYEVKVRVAAWGDSQPWHYVDTGGLEMAPVVFYAIQVDSVTPEEAGFGGGVDVNIVGSGLAADVDGMEVRTCGKRCDVTSAAPDDGTCTIAALREFDPSGEPVNTVSSVISKSTPLSDGWERYSDGLNRAYEPSVCMGAAGCGDHNLVHMRFSGINVPQHATIKSASIYLTSYGTYTSDRMVVNIEADASGDPPPNEAQYWHFANRPRTAANVSWDIQDLRAQGLIIETPDLASVVSAVVSADDWEMGHDMTFFFEKIEGSGQRRFLTSEGALSENDAPRLVIEYQRRSLEEVWDGLSDEELCDVDVVVHTDSQAVQPSPACAAPIAGVSYADDDIGKGKPSWATAWYHTAHAPDMAMRGSGSWRMYRTDLSVYGEEAQFGIDLTQTYALRAVRVDWSYEPDVYLLEASLDNVTYWQVGAKEHYRDLEWFHLSTPDGPSTLARYIRVRIIEHPASDTYVGIYSFDVRGCEVDLPTASSTFNATLVDPTYYGGGGDRRRLSIGVGFGARGMGAGRFERAVDARRVHWPVGGSMAQEEAAAGRRHLMGPPAGKGPPDHAIANIPDHVEFKENLTPIVTSVSPHRGSTAGGTAITITGSNFGSTLEFVKVSVDGVECDVTAVADAAVECTTGDHHTTDRVTVTVYVEGRGDSAPEVDAWYQYIDLWSAKTTWGGFDPPVEGDSVSIPPGQTVLLDVSPPRLFAVLIQGHLIFEDAKDLKFDAHYVMVNGGSLTIGTEEEPHQHNVEITLHGHVKQLWLPVYGTKCIGVRYGTLDLHGLRHDLTWTRLESTAEADSASLHLQEPVTWPVGATIIVTSTDWTKEHTEEAVIAHVSEDGLNVLLEEPLMYQHLGEERGVGGTSFPLRAEVGLLSHNIVIQGDDEYSEEWQFGGTIMLHSPDHESVIGRIEDIEVRQMGQAFTLGKYPIHFHMIGNTKKSYVRRVGVHHTYNRAITIHGVHHLRVQHNVAYHCMGHNYFIEDAIETENVIEGNLGALTLPSMSLLNTDQTPATFWVTNPNNILRNNVAAGSANYGFWYRAEPHVTGAAASKGMGDNVCPQSTPLGIFESNTAHSNGRYGLRIFDVYTPREDPCNSNSALVEAHFNGLVTYRNGKNGVTVTAGSAIVLDNFVFADNKIAGYEGASAQGGFCGGEWGQSRIDNALFIGASGDDFPAPSDLTLGIRGPADNGLTVSDVTFANYNLPNLYAVGACTKCARFAHLAGGWETRYQRVSWVDTPDNRAYWRWEHEGIYYDLDGTLSESGVPGSSIVSASPHVVATEACAADPRYNGGVGGRVCLDTRFTRLTINVMKPTSKDFNAMVFTWNGVEDKRPWLKKMGTAKLGWHITLPVNHVYHMWVEVEPSEEADITDFNFDVGEFRPDDYVVFKADFMQEPDHLEIGGQWQAPEPKTSLAELRDTETVTGSWWWDVDEFDMWWKWTANTWGTTRNRWQSSFDVWDCPRSGCPIAIAPGMPAGDGVIRPWSDPATWDYLGVFPPSDGSDVVVPQFITILVDVNTPILGDVEVYGNLIFAEGPGVNGGEEGPLEFHARRVSVYGWMNAGDPLSEDGAYDGELHIYLYGDKAQPGLLLGDRNLGTKLLAVVGTLRLGGVEHLFPWTRLALGHSASAGDSTIYVERNLESWSVGDDIAIASTTFEPAQAEERAITGIQWDSDARVTIIDLDSPLTYDHLAVEEVHGGHSLPMRAEVALLSRNIKIMPGDDPDLVPADDEDHGCVVVGTNALLTSENPASGAMETNRHFGKIGVAGVEFNGCGQNGFDRHFALEFDDIGDATTEPLLHRTVRNSVFRNGHGKGVGVLDGSAGVFVHDNVFYKTVGQSVETGKTTHSCEIERNLAVWTISTARYRVPDPTEWTRNDDLDPCFEIDGVGHTIVNNVAAGSERAGFKIQGEQCLADRPADDEYPDGNRQRGNEAHSCGIGLWINENGPSYSCMEIVDFTAWANAEFGILAWNPSSFEVRDYKSADNKVGMMLTSFRPASLSHLKDPNKRVKVEGALFVGLSDASGTACDEPLPEHVYLHSFKGPQRAKVPGRLGIMVNTFASGGPKPLWKAPRTTVSSYPAIAGLVDLDGVAFANYGATPDCEGEHLVLKANSGAMDAIHPVHAQNVEWFNVDEDLKYEMNHPSAAWINEEDCIDMDCDGQKNTLLTDVDGTFLGGFPNAAMFSENEFVNSNNLRDDDIPAGLLVQPDGTALTEDDLVHARGIPRPVGCTHNEARKAWTCDNDFTYRMLVIESLDADTETRRLSPVSLLSSGALNQGGDSGGYLSMLNGPADHGWCFGYTCQLRISTFYSIVATPEDYHLTFSSSPPQNLRFHLLNAGDDDGVTLRIWFASPQRLEVYIGDRYVEDLNYDGYEHKSANNPLYEDITPATSMENGANAYFRLRREIVVNVRGSQAVTITTLPVVQVSLTMAVDIDSFFDVQEMFVSNVAFVLNIDPSRIRVVDIVPGSTTVDFEIMPERVDCNDPDNAEHQKCVLLSGGIGSGSGSGAGSASASGSGSSSSSGSGVGSGAGSGSGSAEVDPNAFEGNTDGEPTAEELEMFNQNGGLNLDTTADFLELSALQNALVAAATDGTLSSALNMTLESMDVVPPPPPPPTLTFDPRAAPTADGSAPPQFEVYQPPAAVTLYRGRFTFRAAEIFATEGGLVAEVEVLRVDGAFGDVTVDVRSTTAIPEGTDYPVASLGVDYTALPVQTLSFPAYVTSRTVQIPLLDDDQFEWPLEAIGVELLNPTNEATLGAIPHAVVLIDNDDEASLVSFVGEPEVLLHADQLTHVMSLQRSGNLIGPASVALTTSNDGLEAGAHFTALSGDASVVSFFAGQTRGDVSVSVSVLPAAGAAAIAAGMPLSFHVNMTNHFNLMSDEGEASLRITVLPELAPVAPMTAGEIALIAVGSTIGFCGLAFGAGWFIRTKTGACKVDVDEKGKGGKGARPKNAKAVAPGSTSVAVGDDPETRNWGRSSAAAGNEVVPVAGSGAAAPASSSRGSPNPTGVVPQEPRGKLTPVKGPHASHAPGTVFNASSKNLHAKGRPLPAIGGAAEAEDGSFSYSQTPEMRAALAARTSNK